MSEQPVVASYCTTFLKREMAHIYRQVTGLREFKTFVMARTRLNPERYPFEDVELIGEPSKNFLRRFYLKYILRAEAVVYRGEFQLLNGILQRRAQLMHIYFGHTGVHLLPFIKAWDKPCIVSFHGADITLREHQPGYEAQLREMLKTVPLVMARSRSLRDKLIELGCPEDRIALNRTSVPLQHFPYVARIPPANGQWQNHEGIPNSMLEAMSTGLPVVATLHGGIPEAVEHGRSGLLVAEKDPHALLAALAEVVASHDRWIQMGLKASVSITANFEPRAQIGHLENQYRKVLERK